LVLRFRADPGITETCDTWSRESRVRSGGERGEGNGRNRRRRRQEDTHRLDCATRLRSDRAQTHANRGELTRSSGGGWQQTLDCHTTLRGGGSDRRGHSHGVGLQRDDILEPTLPWRGDARMRGREGGMT
jgi:hypothetical protein